MKSLASAALVIDNPNLAVRQIVSATIFPVSFKPRAPCAHSERPRKPKATTTQEAAQRTLRPEEPSKAHVRQPESRDVGRT